MRLKGYSIKLMGEDGACLTEPRQTSYYMEIRRCCCVRKAQCMDYIESNRDYFEQYVTEELYGISGGNGLFKFMATIWNTGTQSCITAQFAGLLLWFRTHQYLLSQ